MKIRQGIQRAAWLQAAGSQRGAAAVEFAIVCSLLFLLVFGIIEFSIMLYDKAVITNASREGARAGIVWAPVRDLPSVTSLVTEAVDLYATNLINFGETSAIDIDVDLEGTAPGNSLTVSLAYTYNFLVFLQDLHKKHLSVLLFPIKNLQKHLI